MSYLVSFQKRPLQPTLQSAIAGDQDVLASLLLNTHVAHLYMQYNSTVEAQGYKVDTFTHLIEK